MFHFPLFAGILTSTLHVITGPDHLAAVSPLVFETKKKAWKIGLLWGFGHILGMLSIGVLIFFLKEFIPLELISAQSEKIVGIVLVGLGIWTIIKINKEEKHKYPHTHEVKDKTFIHIHNKKQHTHQHKKVKNTTYSTALGIGFIHGLAGIAHFVLLLPALGFNSNWASIVYILGFGIGSIFAMVSYAVILGHISKFLNNSTENKSISIGIRYATGLVAILIGFYWVLY